MKNTKALIRIEKKLDLILAHNGLELTEELKVDQPTSDAGTDVSGDLKAQEHVSRENNTPRNKGLRK